jgi:hypothetical protein
MDYKPLPIPNTDLQGTAEDLGFLAEDALLIDSVVIPLITFKHGQWLVSLVMAWKKNPIQLICRYINSYPTEKKALLHADLFCRTAQKDERGTQKIILNDWNICTN